MRSTKSILLLAANKSTLKALAHKNFAAPERAAGQPVAITGLIRLFSTRALVRTRRGTKRYVQTAVAVLRWCAAARRRKRMLRGARGARRCIGRCAPRAVGNKRQSTAQAHRLRK